MIDLLVLFASYSATLERYCQFTDKMVNIKYGSGTLEEKFATLEESTSLVSKFYEGVNEVTGWMSEYADSFRANGKLDEESVETVENLRKLLVSKTKKVEKWLVELENAGLVKVVRV